MEKNTSVACPICKGDSVFSYAKNSHDIFSCAVCDLDFVWPIPESIADIYSEDYFYKNEETEGFGYTRYNEDKEAMRTVFEKELSHFESRVQKKTIFDVGAATGYFLDIAKKRGWQTAGSEISSYGYEAAKTQGHDMFLGLLPEYTTENTYSLVTMWDVLEHVDDCSGYIKKVNSMLETGGYVLINTIDKSSVWARLWGRKWNMIIPPEHVLFFSKKSLIKLLRQNGFSIVTIKRLSKSFSLSYIFKVLYEWQGFALWKYLAHAFDTPMWRKVTIPINVRDNIYIVAQKQ
ncbi:MAG: class I SAM-dependent methyltransferase [Patescibacteria group bacterium]